MRCLTDHAVTPSQANPDYVLLESRRGRCPDRGFFLFIRKTRIFRELRIRSTLEQFEVMQQKKGRTPAIPYPQGRCLRLGCGKANPEERTRGHVVLLEGDPGKWCEAWMKHSSRVCADALVVLTASRESGLPAALGRPTTRHLRCAPWGRPGKPGHLSPSSGQRCSRACYLFDSSPRCSGLECR